MRIPKEHGAWAMLYVPFMAGALTAGRSTLAHLPELLALWGAATGLFLGRESLLAWWRSHDRQRPAPEDAVATWWQLGGAAICAIVLLWLGVPWSLLPLGMGGALALVVHILQMRRREARTVRNELLAILGLGLTGPGAYIVGRGEWSFRALVLWGLCSLFFASSVLHIKARVLGAQPRRAAERARLHVASFAYHTSLLAILVAACILEWLSALAVVTFVPVIARALAGLRIGSGRPKLMRAGWLEVAYSVWFLAWTVATLR